MLERYTSLPYFTFLSPYSVSALENFWKFQDWLRGVQNGRRTWCRRREAAKPERQKWRGDDRRWHFRSGGHSNHNIPLAFYNFSSFDCTKVVFCKSKVKACCDSWSWKYPGNFMSVSLFLCLWLHMSNMSTTRSPSRVEESTRRH